MPFEDVANTSSARAMDLPDRTKHISFENLPDEILQHILRYVAPHDILSNVQRASKKLHRLGKEPLLWRHHCQVEFKYWDSRHGIRRKFQESVANVDWEDIYLHRKHVDYKTTKALNGILEGQTDRIAKFETIGAFGYDAKDTLLRHYRTDIEVGDGLARRYYANAVLDHLHRAKAIKTWHTIMTDRLDYFEDMETPPRAAISLERALGAYDLFILHDQRGDLEEISDMLDDTVDRFRSEHPSLDQLSTRKKALALVEFLRVHNLTGLTSEAGYRDLQNNYIGIALQHEDHPSLPLISAAIFCSLGRRIGIDARLCGVPNHIHAMVFSRPGETLDGRSLTESQPLDTMYLDPYRSSQEVFSQDIKIMLTQWGIQTDQLPHYMQSIHTSNIILRTARNILATVHEYRSVARGAQDNGHPTVTLHGNTSHADLDNAFYSALWANFMFGNPERIHPRPQLQFVPIILERFERLFPMDASLIETYILPVYTSVGMSTSGNLTNTLHVVRAADQTPKQVHLRQPENQKVIYKVGQVFRHRRYGYTGVIIGWDMECHMNSDWIAQNNVDALSRGRYQSFYHAFTFIADDSTMRYVAEENIEITEPEIPSSLMATAGKYFKRWDAVNRVFVSNIRDEYPED